MKALIMPLALVAFATLRPTGAWAAPSDAPPAEVVAAALEGTTTFLHLQGGFLARLGFESQADVNQAMLGDGVEVFTVDPSNVLNQYGPQTFGEMAIPLNQWQFVISLRGAPKALLTVALIDGSWTAVSLGAAGLAKEVSNLLATRPRSGGYGHRLFTVHQAVSDLMDVSRDGISLGVVPFGHLRQALGESLETTVVPRERNHKDVLSVLRPMVRAGLEVRQ